VEEAQRALLAAKVEASSGYKGLGIVKLMGRSSGFIAMQASMASGAACCTFLLPAPFCEQFCKRPARLSPLGHCRVRPWVAAAASSQCRRP
jgi:6-phosphofructokinase 1